MTPVLYDRIADRVLGVKADTPLETGMVARVLRAVIAVLIGVVAMAALAQLSVKIGPVPITGQTLGVVVVGALLGANRGAATMVTYMGLGLAGLPIFANGGGTIAYAYQPSFGFIIGFIPAAWLVGFLAERGYLQRTFAAYGVFLAGLAVPYLIGLPYLWVALAGVGKSLSIGALLKIGLLPFIPGDLIKCVLAGTAVRALRG